MGVYEERRGKFVKRGCCPLITIRQNTTYYKPDIAVCYIIACIVFNCFNGHVAILVNQVFQMIYFLKNAN